MSLSKLTAESFREHGRPLRIAIDFAIWQFQNQAARGGSNPAIRTLFYRLVRLLATPVQPIFVFDGPHKPTFKRNKRSTRGGAVAATQAQAKQLIRLFGFAVHDAPGEAEAECALLQTRGVVDAVLSEDVDTIMFGCTRTIRNWSSEGRSNTPTHVSLYDNQSLEKIGLDRAGMILVALMSGGDYLPDGIPGCGVKTAYEAAKAGFGRTVCRLQPSNADAVQEWRESLIHELRTNENGFFRTKHKALSIPEDFPNLEVLRYYTHPVVSPSSKLEVVKSKLDRRQELHLQDLREFTRETFDWDYRIGAIKFIRVLGQALLMRKLLLQPADDSLSLKVSGRRAHFSTDGESELRLSFVPAEVVPIDLSEEVEQAVSRDALALNTEEEDVELPPDNSQSTDVVDTTTEPTLIWVLEDVLRKVAPLKVSEWEDARRAKGAKKSSKKSSSKVSKEVDSQRGALDKYVRLTKVPPSASGSVETKATTESKRLRKGMSIPASTPPVPSSTPPSPSSSKLPTLPSLNGRDQPPDELWTSASSQRTPSRTSNAAIIISSSPARATSPSLPPSPRPGTPPTSSEKEPCSLSASHTEEIRDGRHKGVPKILKTVGGQAASSQSSPRATRYKQTSIEMFTQRKAPSSTQAKETPRPGLPVYIDLDNLDSETASPPSSPVHHKANKSKSPGKREKDSSSSGRDVSPTPVTRKKLFIPRTSDIGYFKEVEVDADERDEALTREAKRLESKGLSRSVVRTSEVYCMDLTQDD